MRSRGAATRTEWTGGYQVTSPPAIAGDLVITGSSIADNWRVDTGRGIVRSFAQKELTFADVAALFITHNHYDHIGELADFMISSWLDGRRGRLPVFGPPGTARIYSLLLEEVYDRDLEVTTQVG